MIVARFYVHGVPTPQGSKRAWLDKRTGTVRMIEQADERLKAWRKAVAQYGTIVWAGRAALDAPVRLDLTFALPAPAKSKFGAYPAGTPDLSKLVRAVEDGLVAAGVLVDDARIVAGMNRKRWATDTAPPGCLVAISTDPGEGDDR
jgi:Holliday junction resolvase RusA-like endonuclease